jgi:protein SCO1/2
MKRPRLLAALLVAAGLLAAGAVGYRVWLARPVQAGAAIGGPFQLVDMNGRPVSEKSLAGKPTAIFFGFTYCPEVCPTTLGAMTAAMQTLGPDADRLNVVFVSIDPERDRPEQMKLYLSNFDRRIQGYTGSPQAVDVAARAYRVYYKKVPLDGGDYTMDHSTAVYLMDRKGQFAGLIRYGAPQAEVVDRLRTVIAGKPLA